MYQGHIEQLDEEWDIELVLAGNASTLALKRLLLSVTLNEKCLIMPRDGVGTSSLT